MFRAAPRRRGGLVRAAATTAVVAGTATAVSGRVGHRQDQKYAAQEQDQMAQQAALQSQQELADLEAQVSALQSQQVQQAAMMAPPAAAPAGGGSDVMNQLQQLAQMKQAGLLTDEEFQIAKTRLLAG